MMVTSEVEAEALRIWQAREARMPGPGKRMEPDRMDDATGAWGQCLSAARAALAFREFLAENDRSGLALGEMFRELRRRAEHHGLRLASCRDVIDRRQCITAAKNAVLQLSEDQRRNGDLVHEAIAHAIGQIEVAE